MSSTILAQFHLSVPHGDLIVVFPLVRSPFNLQLRFPTGVFSSLELYTVSAEPQSRSSARENNQPSSHTYCSSICSESSASSLDSSISTSSSIPELSVYANPSLSPCPSLFSTPSLDSSIWSATSIEDSSIEPSLYWNSSESDTSSSFFNQINDILSSSQINLSESSDSTGSERSSESLLIYDADSDRSFNNQFYHRYPSYNSSLDLETRSQLISDFNSSFDSINSSSDSIYSSFGSSSDLSDSSSYASSSN